jgi:hypothetical protein
MYSEVLAPTGLTTLRVAGTLVAPMPIEIEAFLAAYKPKFICLSCLSRMTEREASDVKRAVDALCAERRAESSVAECLNCNVTAFVVRRR